MALGGAPHSGDAAVSNLGPDDRLRHVHRPRTRLGHHSPERTLLRRRCYTLSRAVRLSEAAAPCLRACRLAKQRHAAVAKEAEALRARRAKLAHELRTLEGRCAEKLAATQRECARQPVDSSGQVAPQPNRPCGWHCSSPHLVGDPIAHLTLPSRGGRLPAALLTRDAPLGRPGSYRRLRCGRDARPKSPIPAAF